MSDLDRTTSCFSAREAKPATRDTDLSRRGVLSFSATLLASTMLWDRAYGATPAPFKMIPGTLTALIPENKGLSPAWLKALQDHGKPERFSGKDLDFIGMPIGGIGCGQLYIGGDGRLWLWDIFKTNYRRETDHYQRMSAMTICGHYIDPPRPANAVTRDNGAHVEQGFVVRVKTGGRSETRFLDRRDFAAESIQFRGSYPVAEVTYDDTTFPVSARLRAMTPFVPLDAHASATPATIFDWALTNTGQHDVELQIAGYLENAVCPYNRQVELGHRTSRSITSTGGNVKSHLLVHEVDPAQIRPDDRSRDILIADFDGISFDSGWSVDGQAFARGPAPTDYPGRAPDEFRHAEGERLAASYDRRAAMQDPDALTGSLTSPPIKVERDYVTFLISGGPRKEVTGMSLIVDGKVVATEVGDNSLAMVRKHFDVRAYRGRTIRLRVFDKQGANVDHWAPYLGSIAVDNIRQTDVLPGPGPVTALNGYGSLALGIVEPDHSSTFVNPHCGDASTLSRAEPLESPGISSHASPFNERPVGSVGATLTLKPGETTSVRFVLGWYFPFFNQQDFGPMLEIRDFDQLQRRYGVEFSSAADVVMSVIRKSWMSEATLLWNRTWYDSTLPYWLLDRSFSSMNTLSTNTVHWFSNGRFWGWEGMDSCEGTCTHVWQYAQGMARIFPELERSLRTNVDYGIAFRPDGMIGHRGELVMTMAADGQCGTIIRVLREHRNSTDDRFLRAIWPKVKQSFRHVGKLDRNDDGLLDGLQAHTLDAAWTGEIAWISSLYLAAAAACAEMADDLYDTAFAVECRAILGKGQRAIVSKLFNGEYFIHTPDPAVPLTINTNVGCHIDQVLGQSFAFQAGLQTRIIPKKETVSALQSIWRYNFAPDAGGYALANRDIGQAFRWFAMPGEAGLVMTSWPRGGADRALPGIPPRAKENPDVWTGPGGYFNECMNGFEYQAASHMIYEGTPGSALVENGLAVIRAVHDRYGAAKRNPYDEIECGDHYSRSMASYGVFLAVCGFEYDGPGKHIGFAPKLTPDAFRAPYTSSAGWGTFSQKRSGNTLDATLRVNHGSLELRTVALSLDGMPYAKAIAVTRGGASVPFRQKGSRVLVTFPKTVVAQSDEEIGLTIALA